MTVQKDPIYRHAMESFSMPPDKTIASAITSSMKQLVKVLEKPALIVTYSVSGKTTMRAARERVLVPILNLTIDEKTANKLALIWGVCSVLTKQLQDMTQVTPIAIQEAVQLGLAKTNDELIITAGIPFAKQGNTNILHVTKVE